MKKRFLSLILLLSVLLCGCGSGGADSDEQATTALVIIAGKHANSYNFSDEMMAEAEEVLYECINYGKDGMFTQTANLDITLIVCDGSPRVENLKLGNSSKLTTSANNKKMFNQNVKSMIKAICQKIQSDEVMAKDPGVDLQGALNQARKVLQASKADVKRILILDSGISTENHLDMRKLDILNNSAYDVMNQLDPGTFPDLENIHVTFLGLGNVAAPQEDFGNEQDDEDALVEFWTVYLEEMCRATLDPITYTPGKEGDILSFSEDQEIRYPYVPVVDFYPQPKPGSDEGITTETTTIIKLPSAEVGFVGNQAIFLNERHAMEVLEKCADELQAYLRVHPNAKFYIVGSIARQSLDEIVVNNDRVSSDRANKIFQILVEKFGFDESLFIVIDAGSQAFSWRNAPDDDGHRELNRIVVLFPDECVSLVQELRDAGEIE